MNDFSTNRIGSCIVKSLACLGDVVRAKVGEPAGLWADRVTNMKCIRTYNRPIERAVQEEGLLIKYER
jgi:hypothetical protein